MSTTCILKSKMVLLNFLTLTNDNNKIIEFLILDHRLKFENIEWFEENNRLLQVGFVLYRTNMLHDQIKLRIKPTNKPDESFELKLEPSEYLYQTHQHQPVTPGTPFLLKTSTHHVLGHHRLLSFTQKKNTVNIKVQGGPDYGYYRFVCESGKFLNISIIKLYPI